MSDATIKPNLAHSAAHHIRMMAGPSAHDLAEREKNLRALIAQKKYEIECFSSELLTGAEACVRPVWHAAWTEIGQREYRNALRRNSFWAGLLRPYAWPVLTWLAVIGAVLTGSFTGTEPLWILWGGSAFSLIAALRATRGTRKDRLARAAFWGTLALSFPFWPISIIAFVQIWLDYRSRTEPLRERYLRPVEPKRLAGITIVPPDQPTHLNVMDHGGLRTVSVPTAGRLIAESAVSGRQYPLPEQHTNFSAGALEAGDVVLNIGVADLLSAVISWTPNKGVLPGPQINEFPQIATDPEAFGRACEAHRARLIPLLRVAAKLHRARAPLADAEKELEVLLKQRQAMDGMARAWEDFYLPDETIRPILMNIQLFVENDPAAPDGMLLEGPPGTGKSEIGRRIANSAGMNFIPTKPSDLKGDVIGGSEKNVRELWRKARDLAPCVIFVDECEEALPDMRGNADQFAKAITTAFKAEWDGLQGSERIWVIGATNHPGRIDTAIMRRFRERIVVPLPNSRAREAILRAQLKKMGVTLDVTEAVITATQGLSGADLETAAMQTRRASRMEGVPATPKHLLEAIASIRARDSQEVTTEATFETLVLDARTLESLQTAADMLRNAEALAQKGIRTPRGFLLEGPPGTGKTRIAETLANETGMSFYAPRHDELKSDVVGGTAKQVAAVMERAKERAPVIVFIDEIDTLVPTRHGGDGDAFTTDLVAALLQTMDGIQSRNGGIFFLGATNHSDRIDPAIRRRFEETIHVGLPDQASRRRLLELALKPLPHQIGDMGELLDQMATATEGLSGGHLQNLVARAQRAALHRARMEGDITSVSLTEDDLRQALIEQ